jgi:hypothetical protein
MRFRQIFRVHAIVSVVGWKISASSESAKTEPGPEALHLGLSRSLLLDQCIVGFDLLQTYNNFGQFETIDFLFAQMSETRPVRRALRIGATSRRMSSRTYRCTVKGHWLKYSNNAQPRKMLSSPST